MEDEKSEKISISMPKPVLVAMENYVATLPNETRSGWLTELAMQELGKQGLLPGSDRAELDAAVAEVGGLSEAVEVLRRSARRREAIVASR